LGLIPENRGIRASVSSISAIAAAILLVCHA
jgi:hypothetical protein